jgi:hypothetical protein
MQYKRPFLSVILLLLTVLFACESNEIGESRDVNQDKIYMDYDFSYAEGDENVLLNLQYRFAGSAGTTLVLNNPSRAELDGEILKVDSSEGAGAYYETTKKFADFRGKHQISFTNLNGKRFENSFEFHPVALYELPATANCTKDLVIHFNTACLGTGDQIAISSLETDSSFYYQQTGPAGTITIPAAELKRQKSGEIQFESTVYREIPLLQTTAEGGLLRLTYRLKPVKILLQP